MSPSEFRTLWNLRDKCVNEDIVFTPMRGFSDGFEVKPVPVLNTQTPNLLIGGSFNCKTRAVVYNFQLEGFGPICRYCAGGVKHPKVGRWHRHIYLRPGDVASNLPRAERRDDLKGLTPRAVWAKLCAEAGIVHTQKFFDPEVKC